MKMVNKYIVVLLLSALSSSISGQTDEDPPDSPKFTFVTINPATGRTEMTWSSNSDPDLAGYVVYHYRNGEGYVIDTIFDRAATSYSFLNLYANERIESYVIAAFDSSRNISPLSNELHTIYAASKTDTCNNRINLSWNKYSSVPVNVTGYDILASVNSSTYYLAGHVSADVISFTLDNFQNDAQYCFIIKALLENGLVSSSNRSCITVKMQNPPLWINADYATVTTDGSINLSFTIDPSSEIDTFAVERKTGYSGSFQKIDLVTGTDIKSAKYTDKTAEKNKIYFYKLDAVKCKSYMKSSNIASNIVLNTQNTGSEIILKWNQYHDWLGSVSSYRIFADKGNGYAEEAATGPSDTAFTISTPGIMYALTQGKVCLYITATESGNPYGISGEANSNRVCSEIEEVITVPNIFVPVGYKNSQNALFKPVLTFTPSDYRLVIRSRQGKTLFETNDFMASWDGSDNGNPVPEGVYLWFLKIKTPEGKSISRSGTVTVVKN
jgi:hypothetical protein